MMLLQVLIAALLSGSVAGAPSNEAFSAYTEHQDWLQQQQQPNFGLIIPQHVKRGRPFVRSNEPVPEAIDWRLKGAVTAVKNQGNCGSCWAFSTVGALEGQHFLRRSNATLIQLSEQNLVDCVSWEYEGHGCNGGFPMAAMEFIHREGGIDTEVAYPYKGKDMPCHFSRKTIGETDEGYVSITEGDEDELKAAVAQIGPISVAIRATSSFMHYKRGIFYQRFCALRAQINHAVLVVGYGSENGKDYWIVKNSWGTDWGERGYVRMARNRGNNCAIATYAAYPIVR